MSTNNEKIFRLFNDEDSFKKYINGKWSGFGVSGDPEHDSDIEIFLFMKANVNGISIELKQARRRNLNSIQLFFIRLISDRSRKYRIF